MSEKQYQRLERKAHIMGAGKEVVLFSENLAGKQTDKLSLRSGADACQEEKMKVT
jgi:hypothetical protein